MTKKIKSIIVGASRVLDFSGSALAIDIARCRSMREYYAKRTDAEALQQDLTKVGRDMTNAMGKAKVRA